MAAERKCSEEALDTHFRTRTESVVMVLDPVQKTLQSSTKDGNAQGGQQSAGQAAAEKDLETFQFEVTAGKKLLDGSLLQSASDVTIRRDQPHIAGSRIAPKSVEAPLPIADNPKINIAKSSSLQPRRTRFPSWATSLLVHLLVILGLAYFTFSTLEPRIDFTLSLESEAFAEDEIEFQEIVIDPLEEIELDENRIASEIQEASQLSASELSAEVALADLTNISATQETGLGDLTNLFGDQGTGLSEMIPAGAKLTASFFGTKVEGRRIVYVVDNSGGMRGGELETLVDELLKSVESLTDEQEFYVIFYSDMLYPLFYPHPVQRFVPANDRFKQRLRKWLETVEFCLGNEVDKAIEAATMIRPDVVYLLTDGDLDSTRDQRRMAYLLNARGRKFKIHTFGMGTGEKGRAAEKLRLVADANDGTFRAVEVSDVFKEAALEKKRPYHDKKPGKVWGLNVGSGWGKKW